MLSHWFIMLPEILLIAFMVIAGVINRYRVAKTPKTFFTLAQFFLAAVLLFTMVFYNKSAFPQLWQNTPFVTLFKACAYLLAFAWFYLSSKWFLNKNRPSGIFCGIVFFLLMCFDILASSVSLITLGFIVPLIFIGNFYLLLRHWDIEKVKPTAVTYGILSIIFCFILWIGIAILYRSSGSFAYAEVRQYMAEQPYNNIYLLLAIASLITVFMFLFGAAPFHIWFIGFINNGVLPVCGFITLIPPIISFCALINLIKDCLYPFAEFINMLLLGFAVLSIIVGSLSTNGEKNIRCLFAYISIYCLGVSLIGLVDFSPSSIIASFAYIITSIISFAGVYTVFLGLKSHGEYLSDIVNLKGFSNVRPYMSAALMVFMFSFIGLAPTFGLLGYMSVIDNLLSHSAFVRLAILICGLFMVSKSCLDIIRVVYFENDRQSYDRPDKSIYIFLFLIVAIIVLSLFNPNWLMRNAVMILEGIGQ